MTRLTLQDMLGDGESTTMPNISSKLCTKATEHNDELTKVERLLFLSRLDLAGQTFWRPESLTVAEKEHLCAFPPPDVLSDVIQRLIGGGRTTIAHVVRDYWSTSGDRTSELSGDALCTIMTQWFPSDLYDLYHVHYLDDATTSAAFTFVGERLRQEETAFEDAARDAYMADKYVQTEQDGALWDEFGDEEDSLEEWKAKRMAFLREYRRDISQRREELRAKLAEELESTTEEDVQEFRELQKRMAMEAAVDRAEIAARKQKEEGDERTAKDDKSSLESGEVPVADIYGSMDDCEFFRQDL